MNYTNSEFFELPSKGKIYGKTINPEVQLRSMRTLDEMKRCATTNYQYKKLASVIEDCLITKLDIPVYDLCIGDYQYLVHKLRTVTYGPDYKIALQCPVCGKIFSTTISLDDLKVMTYTEDWEKLKRVHLPVSDKEIELRVQTPRLLDLSAIESRERNEKYRENMSESDDLIIDQSYLVTLKSIIKTVDGEALNEAALEQFVSNLPMMDTNILLQSSQKLDEAIGLDTSVHVKCPNPKCKHNIDYSFRITGEFFVPTID